MDHVGDNPWYQIVACDLHRYFDLTEEEFAHCMKLESPVFKKMIITDYMGIPEEEDLTDREKNCWRLTNYQDVVILQI